jgi:hypothetical protein
VKEGLVSVTRWVGAWADPGGVVRLSYYRGMWGGFATRLVEQVAEGRGSVFIYI